MQISFATLSENGGREVNEDAIEILSKNGQFLFALADGLGGHGHGEIASRTVVEEAVKSFPEINSDLTKNTLGMLFDNSQKVLLEKQKELHKSREMKTTLALLCLKDCKTFWGHVGDSRIYGFSKNKLAFRTLDHSIPQMLVLSGDIPERKIRNHPERSMLLRVMGVDWEDNQPYELSDIHEMSDFQAYLLCSDGFWELIDEKMMCKTLKKSGDVEEWLGLMKRIVEKNGAKKEMDNYSAIAVWVEE